VYDIRAAWGRSAARMGCVKDNTAKREQLPRRERCPAWKRKRAAQVAVAPRSSATLGVGNGSGLGRGECRWGNRCLSGSTVKRKIGDSRSWSTPPFFHKC
jgi:hypothetical protein